ncbi:MAG: LysR family transcriptional regulator [Polyangiales bacterium]
MSALITFERVARHLRFARAASELRVTPTAVSKTIATLEAQLGVRLFQRTTRSVALTQAGQRLLEAAAPALATLQRGIEDARTTSESAAGELRVNTSYVAYSMLFEPHLRGFLAAHPRVSVSFTIESVSSDIVARGFDAGVRPGRAVKQDMIAVPLGAVQRFIVVAAPRYLGKAGRPKEPHELLGHACIRQRVNSEQGVIPWTLRRGRERTTLDVTGPLLLDDMRAVLGAACAGNGLAYVFEQFAAPAVATGALERVLPEHALVREAFYLYYPSRRQLPPKLQVFVAWFREQNRA